MRTRRSLMLIILIAATGACKLVRKDDDRKPWRAYTSTICIRKIL
jgi:hypothetical protein